MINFQNFFGFLYTMNTWLIKEINTNHLNYLLKGREQWEMLHTFSLLIRCYLGFVLLGLHNEKLNHYTTLLLTKCLIVIEFRFKLNMFRLFRLGFWISLEINCNKSFNSQNTCGLTCWLHLVNKFSFFSTIKKTFFDQVQPYYSYNYVPTHRLYRGESGRCAAEFTT